MGKETVGKTAVDEEAVDEEARGKDKAAKGKGTIRSRLSSLAGAKTLKKMRSMTIGRSGPKEDDSSKPTSGGGRPGRGTIRGFFGPADAQE